MVLTRLFFLLTYLPTYFSIMKNGARGVWKWPAESVSHCDNRTLGFIKRVPYFSFLAGCYSTKVVVPSITATMYLAKVQCSCWNIFARFLLTLTLQQAEILGYKSLQNIDIYKKNYFGSSSSVVFGYFSFVYWYLKVPVNKKARSSAAIIRL